MLGGILVTTLFLIYIKLAQKPDNSRNAHWSAAWPWLITNCLSGPTLGVTCYQWALINAPTKIVLPIVSTTPLVVIPLARLMEGERITKRAVFGGIVAVGGVIGLTLVK